MKTTAQQIRDIIKLNREVLGIETTKEMLMNGYYKFQTNNADTIERAFRKAREELRTIEETEKRIRDEFKTVAIAIGMVFLVIGIAVGKIFF